MRPRSSTLREYERLFEDVVIFLDDRYGDADLTIDDFAASSYASVRTIQRALNYSGKSWIAMLRNKRMYEAGRMLRDSDAKIRSISMMCGFSNFSHFIKVFNEFYGATPSEYRRQHKREEHGTRQQPA